MIDTRSLRSRGPANSLEIPQELLGLGRCDQVPENDGGKDEEE